MRPKRAVNARCRRPGPPARGLCAYQARLSYELELPERPGEVQEELNIERQAATSFPSRTPRPGHRLVLSCRSATRRITRNHSSGNSAAQRRLLTESSCLVLVRFAHDRRFVDAVVFLFVLV